ncbi:hypothetical protein QWY93_14815 [Echinicola jeungdonensis]|uniref:Transposase n=1 Tax=Echinicola jeungdonensis TaxID=709343 RepID=A0ABV5J308_9BACT|nr:hypothetical protein [Echinicola jeungdonensis]MDN3670592.1 hypothetical protein [Echinicola jeungdonensis]
MGAYKAVSFPIDMGYQRIVHIRGRMIVQHSNERCRVYVQALNDKGLMVSDD